MAMDITTGFEASKRMMRLVRRRVFPNSDGRSQERQTLIEQIATRPLDDVLHRKLALHYLSTGRLIPAIAECRTSLALNPHCNDEARALLAKLYDAVGLKRLSLHLTEREILPAGSADESTAIEGTEPDIVTNLSPPTYQRIKALSSRITQTMGEREATILDVGGGDGALCLLLPNARYVLAEPRINGLRGDFTFPKGFFDVVVACHVLEHVQESEKEVFLETLCELASKLVIVLGPVERDAGAALDSLIYRITRYVWAAEHLDCRLPSLQMFRDFAQKHALECNVMANGDLAATYWMVFAGYYAALAKRTHEFQEVRRFSNLHLNDHLSNPQQPNDYLVELIVGGPDRRG
jgi:hypothetical protein